MSTKTLPRKPYPRCLMRQGNFSELLSPNPFYSGSHAIYQPGTCPSVGAASCMPFSGNIIPPGHAEPERHRHHQRLPAPTPGFQVGANNLYVQASHPINQRKGDLNIDIMLNDKNRLSVRRSDLSYYEFIPFDQGSGLTPRFFHRPNQTNTVSLTSTITPSLVNEARISLEHRRRLHSRRHCGARLQPPGSGGRRSRSLTSCRTARTIPNKIPTVSVPNFYGLAGGPYPSHSSGTIWTGGDNLTKVWNNHTFKFGVSFEYSGENDGDQINVNTVPGGASNQNGTFIFSDARTGLGATSGIGMANLALGLADTYTEIGPRALTIWRALMWEAYAQDSWKVTPKLHIEYGLRWSNIAGFHPLWGNADYFDGALYNASQAVQVSPTTGQRDSRNGQPVQRRGHSWLQFLPLGGRTHRRVHVQPV